MNTEEIITIECTLCPQTFTDKISEMWKRTNRHINRHTKHVLFSQRDGHQCKGYGMGNLIYGKTEWITL